MITRPCRHSSMKLSRLDRSRGDFRNLPMLRGSRSPGRRWRSRPSARSRARHRGTGREFCRGQPVCPKSWLAQRIRRPLTRYPLQIRSVAYLFPTVATIYRLAGTPFSVGSSRAAGACRRIPPAADEYLGPAMTGGTRQSAVVFNIANAHRADLTD